MKVAGSSPTISKHHRQSQEGLSSTKADLVQRSLISSNDWLQLHGLKSNKLTLNQILSHIGFPHCEEYVTSLGRPVASRYADGLFPQFCRVEDGKKFNLTANSELLSQFVQQLTKAVESYKQRMDWLTSRSRQIFGVILEQCITIVLDLSGMLEQELNLCQDALIMVLQEQVAHIDKFNIIWVSQKPVKLHENATPVTQQSIAAAINWVKELTFMLPIGPTSCLDALLEAGKDRTIEAIYYFVVGDVPEEYRNVLQSALDIPGLVCIVSFNSRGKDTIDFLKELSARTNSRFHAFAERTQCVEFPDVSITDGDHVRTWNERKLKGKLPPGAEVREDVFLIWREMEEACSTLAQVQMLVSKFPKSNVSLKDCEPGIESVDNQSNVEHTWDSTQWLKKYGLKAQKLSFYDVLADCSFRHVDGIVDIKVKPDNEFLCTSAETNKKTVHAKYCSKFVHAPWKDGSLVHVCITKEKCTWYTERIRAVLAQIHRRIKWLQNRSENLFGKVCTDYIYILIDTSHSMQGKLDLVKDKIVQFIQEQLQYKRKFNFVQFDAQAVAWREKLVEIDEDNLKQAQSWIRGIKIGSSTNTLDALQIAFSDQETQVIYLLTDGRPDQPPEVVIDHIKVFKKIPIYTISFNYYDEVANGFLKMISSMTGGEFYCYNFCNKDPYLPETVQNEDLKVLIKEVEQGHKDLEKLQNLYSESLVLDWWYNCIKERDRHAKEISSVILPSEKCAHHHSGVESKLLSSLPKTKVQKDPSDKKTYKKKVLHAESTKTSMLRSQLSMRKNLADSARNDSFSSSSNWSTSGDKEMSIHLANECSDDNLLETVTEERNQNHNLISSGMSTATWLNVHGLAAKKLTIKDVFSVPHCSSYVPILDKSVVSKVFHEVFHMAQVCNDTNTMSLINPQGFKLSIYKQNVEQAIKSYERRLNQIVWRALSQEEKEKLESNKPIMYLENKEALNQALERLNWPISLQELSMLEDEILAGKMYIQQAMELEEVIKKEHERRTQIEQQKSTINVSKKNKSKKLDPLKGQKVIARCDENGFYFPGVVKKCVSPTQALVDFRYGDTKVVPISFITPVGGAMPCPLLQVGDYVFAKIVTTNGFDFYVPAIVIALPNQNVAEDKFYTVLKCNNRKEFCTRGSLIKISQNKYALCCSQIKSPLLQDYMKLKDTDSVDSTLLLWPLEIESKKLQELKHENNKKKKKRSTKRFPLEESVSLDSGRHLQEIKSKEPYTKSYHKPKVRDRHFFSEQPKISLNNSATEIIPQFPGQFRSQHSKNTNT